MKRARWRAVAGEASPVQRGPSRFIIALLALLGLGCGSPDTGDGWRSSRKPTQPDLSMLVSGIETWVVHTRGAEQSMKADLWTTVTVARLPEGDGPLIGSTPEALYARIAGRPVVISVHGYGYTQAASTKEARSIRNQLEGLGGLTPDTIFIAFDWPSERVLANMVTDLNDKAKRSRVAGYHLGEILAEAPPGMRITLLGHSDGGRVVLTALHLLSGNELPAFLDAPAVRLKSARPDLRFRAVTLEAALGHDWLNPGRRLDSALPMTERLLNLYNKTDPALAVYTLGQYTGFGPALGKVGLTRGDLRKLGPLAARVEQRELHDFSAYEHTPFIEVLTFPAVAERIARYTSWAADVDIPAEGSIISRKGIFGQDGRARTGEY